jgi:hypothetical protein
MYSPITLYNTAYPTLDDHVAHRGYVNAKVASIVIPTVPTWVASAQGDVDANLFNKANLSIPYSQITGVPALGSVSNATFTGTTNVETVQFTGMSQVNLGQSFVTPFTGSYTELRDAPLMAQAWLDPETPVIQLSAQLNVGSMTIRNVADPVDNKEAANKRYVDNAIASITLPAWVASTQGTVNADLFDKTTLSIDYKQITNITVQDPITDLDTANKRYVDTVNNTTWTAMFPTWGGELTGAIQFTGTDIYGHAFVTPFTGSYDELRERPVFPDINTFVPRSGGSVGPLVLDYLPMNPDHAVHKDYVDTAISNTGIGDLLGRIDMLEMKIANHGIY